MEQNVGYRFANPALLRVALRHSSLGASAFEAVQSASTRSGNSSEPLHSHATASSREFKYVCS